MSPRSRWTAAALLGSTLTALAAPALPAEPEEEITWQTIFRGTTEVNVVNVDVVVSDADGRPVSGLGVEEFTVFENGRPVEISNFFATTGGRSPQALAPPAPGEAAEYGAAAEQRPHYLILFIDEPNLREANRARVFAQLRQFVLDNWRPDLRVMVASNRRDLALHGKGFAEAPHDVFAALEAIQRSVAPSQRFDLDERQLLDAMQVLNVEACSGFFATTGPTVDQSQQRICEDLITEARALMPRLRDIAEQQMVHVRQTLRVVRQMVDLAAGLPGRKSMVYVSDRLPLRPGAALFEGLSRRLDPIADRFDYRPQLEADRYDLSPDLEQLVTRANTAGVTFYTLYADRPAALTRGSAAIAGSASGNFGTWSAGFEAGVESSAQESLILMAEQTGGRYALAVAGSDELLGGLIDDGDNYYSLGYVAEPGESDRPREIQVKVSDPRWKLRFRRRFRDRSLVERTEQRTRAALLARPEDNPLGISVAAEPPRPDSDGSFVVPLRIGVPLGRLLLVPGSTEHQAKVSIFVVVWSARGGISGMTRHLCPIRIANDEILAARGRSAACGVNLRLESGPQRIAVSLLDEIAAADSTVALDLAVGQTSPAAEG